MNNHLDRLLKKAEALACQCEPAIGYSCNVHRLFGEIREAIGCPVESAAADSAPECAEELDAARARVEAAHG